MLAMLDHESFFHAVMATIPSSILILDEASRRVDRQSQFPREIARQLEFDRGAAAPRNLSARVSGYGARPANPRRHRHRPDVHRQRMTYRAPGVSLRIYSYSICPLQLRDASRGAILVMDDVTDLLQLGEEVRRMQLHLASIVESAGDLIISTDRAGAIMTWNTAAEKATGSPNLKCAARKLADHIEEPQVCEEVEACFREIAEIDDRRSVEWPMRCRNGESIPVSWRLSRMTGDIGEVTGVVVVGRNLVEQRAMEAQMRQGEKLAALGMVIGGIAHEIRNPSA